MFLLKCLSLNCLFVYSSVYVFVISHPLSKSLSWSSCLSVVFVHLPVVVLDYPSLCASLFPFLSLNQSFNTCLIMFFLSVCLYLFVCRLFVVSHFLLISKLPICLCLCLPISVYLLSIRIKCLSLCHPSLNQSLSVCLYIYLSLLSICCLNVCLSLCHPSLFFYVCTSYLSVCAFVRLSVCLSLSSLFVLICLYIYLSL